MPLRKRLRVYDLGLDCARVFWFGWASDLGLGQFQGLGVGYLT